MPSSKTSKFQSQFKHFDLKNPFQRPPQRSQSASRAGNRRTESRALIADSQTSQHLQYVHDREEVCPSRAQLEPCNTPYNKFHPKRIVQVFS